MKTKKSKKNTEVKIKSEYNENDNDNNNDNEDSFINESELELELELKNEEENNEENNIENCNKKRKGDNHEREYYERAYLDFFRFKMPKTDDFVDYVIEEFKKENYSVTDYMSKLSKDTKCCIVNYLGLFDVCRLARTCNSYREIIDNVKYNEYWKQRQRKNFPFSYMECGGLFRYRTTVKTVLWFDVYQYSIFSQNSLGLSRQLIKKLTLNKQAFNTFVKGKRDSFPKTFKINVCFGGEILKCLKREFKFSVDGEFLKLIGYDTKTHGNKITYNKLISHVKEYCCNNYATIDKNLMGPAYKALFPVNPNQDYYYKTDCLFNIPLDFITKWGLNNPKEQKSPHQNRTTCYCIPNYYRSSLYSGHALYADNHTCRCISNYCNGPIIDELKNEAQKYKCSFVIY